MALLRCTSCDRRFSRTDAVRSDFKCPRCGGLALFDWTGEGGSEEYVEREERPRGRLSRWLRRGAG